MVVVIAATGGVQPALGPRPLKSSRALHRAGTLTLASPSAPSALLQHSAARPSDLRPLQTQVKKKIPKISTRSAGTQAEAKRSGAAGEEENSLRRNREAELRREICALDLWGEVWWSGGEGERCCAWVLCLLCSLSRASA